MKALCCILIATFAAQTAFAQFCEAPKQRANVFFGPVGKISTLKSDHAYWVGGEIGWLFDGGAAIGGGLYTLASSQSAPGYVNAPHIGITYYGILLSYVADWQAPAQPMVSLLWGMGSMNPHYRGNSLQGRIGSPDESSEFIVFEPTASVQVNYGRHIRAVAGIGTRFTSGLNSLGYTDDDLNHLTWTVGLRIVDL